MTIQETDQGPQSRRKEKLRFWWLMVLLMAIALGLLLWFWSRDSEPVDDSKYLPTFTEGGGPNNPLIGYAQALAQLPDSGYDRLPQEAKDRKKGQEKNLLEFLSKPEVQRRVELWDELMKTDPTLWRWRWQDRLPLNINPLEPSLSEVQSNMGLQRIRAILLAREGKVKDAIALAFQILHMGKGLSKAEGSLISFLVAITAQQISYETLHEILSEHELDEVMLRDILNHLGQLQNSRQALQTSFKMEYQYVKTIIEAAAHAPLPTMSSPLLDWFAQKSYKSHQTLILFLETYGSLVESANGNASELIEASEVHQRNLEAWKRKSWIKFLDKNWMGQMMIGMTGPTYYGIVKRAISNEINPALMQVNVALRLYELKHGKLPVDLEALESEFSVPMDPFDGQPLRWNPKTQRIYSVWINKSDDDGSFQKSFSGSREPLDYGMIYSWSPEAKGENERE